MIKLTYFNVTALAEPIRWLFKIKGIDFEDERFEFADWPNVKKSGRFPAEQMPVLEIDGEQLTQSVAILRYLGTKHGLVGDDPLSNYRLDQVADIVTDGRLAWRNWFMSPADKKDEVKAGLLAGICPLVFKQLEQIISKTEGDFILGSKLTWADLFLAVWLDIWTNHFESTILDAYPVLAKQRDAVLEVPQVKAWVEIRPKTL